MFTKGINVIIMLRVSASRRGDVLLDSELLSFFAVGYGSGDGP